MPNFAGFKDSLWSKTAVNAAHYQQLNESLYFDVAVIGAGFTGLSTALALLEQGLSVAVLDKYEPGWGASGRNGGQIIPGLKWDPDQLQQKLGAQAGNKMFEFAKSSSNNTFKLIEENGLNCGLNKSGWLQPIHNQAAISSAQRRADLWRARGVAVKTLSKSDAQRMIGSDYYQGALLYPNGGNIQPLSYARELARVIIEKGGVIFRDAEVTSYQKSKNKRWLVKTPCGEINAEKVLVATNGYSDSLVKGLRKSVVDLTSFIVASKPLPETVRGTIIPGGQGCSDTRRILTYMRMDDQGRLLLGGRGSYSSPTSKAAFADVESKLNRIFPQLKGLEWDYRWFGRFAVTNDFLPHLHEPEPGFLCMLGYSGRGVAMGSAIGSPLAQYIKTGDKTALPIAVSPLTPIPFYPLRRLGITALTNWYRFLDMWG